MEINARVCHLFPNTVVLDTEDGEMRMERVRLDRGSEPRAQAGRPAAAVQCKDTDGRENDQR